MSAETVADLTAVGLPAGEVEEIVRRTLAEDLGPDGLDVTSVATIPADQRDTADLVARASGVVAGLAVARAVFEAASGGTTAWVQSVADGDRVARGDVLATVSGPTRALLTAERSALNLVCRMSGVATHTRAWADQLAGSKAQVLDTRKTTPGLRVLEKYAVRAGGGTNKRMGLYDVAMVKDNHVAAAGGSVTAAVDAIRARFPGVAIQVEADTLAQATEALGAGADFLLLDNMPTPLLRVVVAAVRAREGATGHVELEATGRESPPVASSSARSPTAATTSRSNAGDMLSQSRKLAPASTAST
ncbi:MAG TPA: carboxylating nicotinate-nucleotide diphosphorylase, partial [Rugosimonospora sp.]|nr:carboxylating nicotinate-nucleotide diphosphorylase [Rugosimonospora sp.]